METFRATQLSGASSVCCISGYAGIGKTSLARLALEKMREEGAITASAKFEQYNENIPFTAIVPFPFVVSLMQGSMYI